MNSVTNKGQEIGKTKLKRFHFTKRGLLNSRYKRIVKYTFKKARKKSVFAIRQRAKYPKFSNACHVTTMALKISVFAVAAILVLT